MNKEKILILKELVEKLEQEASQPYYQFTKESLINRNKELERVYNHLNNNDKPHCLKQSEKQYLRNLIHYHLENLLTLSTDLISINKKDNDYVISLQLDEKLQAEFKFKV